MEAVSSSGGIVLVCLNRHLQSVKALCMRFSLLNNLENFGCHFSDASKACQCKLFYDKIDICVSCTEIFIFYYDTK